MGIYINPGNENLKEALRSEIFVDKSLILKKFCGLMNTKQKFVCISRPRRFGKTMVRDLMAAYFSKGCDSIELFKDLKIATESCFAENLNKFNVITIDLGSFYNRIKNKAEILDYLKNEILQDFRNEFPDIELSENMPLADMIQRIYTKTGIKFVIIIDEYDTFIRERQSEILLEEYRSFLNSIFKNNELSPAIALAYLTGILPIERDKVQSKLNNFKESNMLSPFGFEEYFGFTKEEVETLCDRYEMSFAECESWYDGYKIGSLDIYNPNSLVEAMMRHEYGNYWQATGSYEAVSDYIKLDYKGIRTAITDMMAGEQVPVNVVNFKNSLNEINSKDNVLTYLIHLGYLNYDNSTGLCRIPNKEIRQEWESAVGDAENFSKIAEMIDDSNRLLKWTIEGEAERVAAALDNAHLNVADPLDYNDKSSLKTAIILAYYTARSKYTIVKGLPSGKGFADIAFIPLEKNDPAIIVELKWNKDADTAIKQIKEKRYPAVLENYLDNLLLVGVNYDKNTKVHDCVIEKYQK
ncbi:AAA family ATPase [bacterium]|nr:AAA family ATPase [bacterium]